MHPGLVHRRSKTRLLLSGALLLAACGEPVADYFPLQPGRSWQYRITLELINSTDPQKLVVTNVGKAVRDGLPVYLQQSQGGPLAEFQHRPEGLVRIGTAQRRGSDDVRPTLIMPDPPQPGYHWQVQSRLRLIESRTFAREDKLYRRVLAVPLTYRVERLDAQVRTPAGRFPDCLEISAQGRATVIVDRGNASAEVSVQHVDWYAPGVGLVKSVRTESSASPFLKSGTYTLELERYN